MFGFHEGLTQKLSDRGREQPMSYQKFRAAWHNFLSLLDIDFEEGFSCTECGAEPKRIIMDGTSVSVMKHRLGAERAEDGDMRAAVQFRYESYLFLYPFQTQKGTIIIVNFPSKCNDATKNNTSVT